MSVDENLMCSFQILRPVVQKTIQDTTIKGTPMHTTNSKAMAPTKSPNIKK